VRGKIILKLQQIRLIFTDLEDRITDNQAFLSSIKSCPGFLPELLSCAGRVRLIATLLDRIISTDNKTSGIFLSHSLLPYQNLILPEPNL
jgi:hypothetical protein